MKILLTGGSGFIGKNVAESYLNEKYEIVAPSRSVLDCADDASVKNFFSHHSFDVIIHSAAKPGHRNAGDRSGILYTNSRMIVNLLNCQSSWGRLINMGSGAIYDMEHYQPKMKEEYAGTHIPLDEHGYNKYICDLLFRNYKNIVDFRIFGIFGKYEDYAIRFISNGICKTLFDLPITLRKNRKFDYLFIDDLYPILDYFIVHKSNHSSYNITPDSAIELLTVAEIIQEVGGAKNKIIVGQDGLSSEYSGDNARLRNEFKEVKFTPIRRSIEHLFDWYQANSAGIRKELLLIDK